ncbi:hypothetical protein HDU83_000958 [Entophlyctis luteolus]|nr:hypothetical protein HDU83_000958 [Entophlyctis luteolus]
MSVSACAHHAHARWCLLLLALALSLPVTRTLTPSLPLSLSAAALAAALPATLPAALLLAAFAPTRVRAASSSSSCAATYSQCGGYQWTGPVCCSDPADLCVYSSDFYSQCLPASSTTISSPSSTSSSSSSSSSSIDDGGFGFIVDPASSSSASSSSSSSSSISTVSTTSDFSASPDSQQPFTSTITASSTVSSSSSAVNQSGAGPIIAGIGAACVVLLAAFAFAFAYQRTRGAGAGRRSPSSSATGSGSLVGIGISTIGSAAASGALGSKPKFSSNAAGGGASGVGNDPRTAPYVDYGETKYFARQLLDVEEEDETAAAVSAATAEPEFSYTAPAPPRQQPTNMMAPAMAVMPSSPEKQQSVSTLQQLQPQAPVAAMQMLRGVVQIPQVLRKPASQKLSQTGSDGQARNATSKLGAMPSHLASDLNSKDPLLLKQSQNQSQSQLQNQYQSQPQQTLINPGYSAPIGDAGSSNQLLLSGGASVRAESPMVSLAARPGVWRPDNSSSYLSYPASIVSSQAPSSLYMDTIVQNDRIEFSDNTD